MALVERSDSELLSGSDIDSFDAPGSPEYPLLSSGIAHSGDLETGNETSSRTPLSERQPRRRLSISAVLARSKSSLQHSEDEEMSEPCNPRKKKKADGKENSNGDDSLATTNALLLSLIKRLDRQEKKLSKMEQKFDQRAMCGSPSSSSCTSTPRRAVSRHKDVPLEVRVSCKH